MNCGAVERTPAAAASCNAAVSDGLCLAGGEYCECVFVCLVVWTDWEQVVDSTQLVFPK